MEALLYQIIVSFSIFCLSHSNDYSLIIFSSVSLDLKCLDYTIWGHEDKLTIPMLELFKSAQPEKGQCYEIIEDCSAAILVLPACLFL